MRLLEKGVFLTASYQIKEYIEYGEQLDETQLALVKKLQEYNDLMSSKGFSEDEICRIFELIRACRASREGNLARRECYQVSHIDRFLRQSDGDIELCHELRDIPQEIQKMIHRVPGSMIKCQKSEKKNICVF